jgi:hypothetical protein
MKIQTTSTQLKNYLAKLLPLVNDMNSCIEELCIAIKSTKDGIFAQVVNSNSHNVILKLTGSCIEEGHILVQSNYISELVKRLPNDVELYIIGNKDTITFDLLSLGTIQKPTYQYSKERVPFEDSPLSKEIDWEPINNIVSFSNKEALININIESSTIRFMCRDPLGNSMIRYTQNLDDNPSNSTEVIIKRYIADFIKNSEHFSLYKSQYPDIFQIVTERINFIFRSVPSLSSEYKINNYLMDLQPLGEIQISYQQLLAACDWQSTGLSPIDVLSLSLSNGELNIKGKYSTEPAAIQLLSLTGQWKNIDINSSFLIKLLSTLKLNNHNLSLKLVSHEENTEVDINTLESIWLVINPSINFNGHPTGLISPSFYLV